LPSDIQIPDLDIDSVFGTHEQIYNELENSVLPDEEAFNDLQIRVDKIDEIISYYRSALLDEGKRFSKIRNNMFYAPSKCNFHFNFALLCIMYLQILVNILKHKYC
jgi:hypothetical protein